MAGRTPSAASAAFVNPLQRAVSCVSTAVLFGQAFRQTAEPHLLRFSPDAAVRLGRFGPLFLTTRLHYLLVEVGSVPRVWAARTVAYSYRILSREEREVIAYHWHPEGGSPVTYPHLHVRGSSATVDLSKAHLPTGQVTLIDILRLAITDLGVEPLRPDWRTTLEQSEEDLAVSSL